MSTPSEDKMVAFLRRLQAGGLDSNPLSYIKKIYSDRPRKEVKRSDQFPRLQVTELGKESVKFSGIGATDRIYGVILGLIVYVDMDSPFDYTDPKISAFWSEGRNMSPEEATGSICYHVAKELGENKATLASDNSGLFQLRGLADYKDLGVDNSYFDNVNVYKGRMDVGVFLRD